MSFSGNPDSDYNDVMNENAKLTKAEIIEKIAAAFGDNPTEILRIINGFFGVLSDGLLEGRTAELRGFGTSRSANARAARMQRTRRLGKPSLSIAG